jgi:outer membrane murein-binding lipoprotein Lpp
MSGAAKTLTRIRLAAHRAKGSSRAPFMVLVVALLGGGLLSLLLLNTALNQGSFEVGRLQKEQDRMSDERQALQRELDARAAPGELARRAQEMGMVPGGSPAFIDPVTGQVLGVPKPAVTKPPLVTQTPLAPVVPPSGPPPAGSAAGAPAPDPGAAPTVLAPQPTPSPADPAR